jgi:hypothetical protein
MDTIILVALGAFGATTLAVGAWTAVQRRRPSWLPARSITPATARAWGVATALGGLGLLILSIDLLGPGNRAVEVGAFPLLVVGAGVIVVAPPGNRRRR